MTARRIANADFDVCVVGSGAGGGPVALRAAEAGLSVVVLERGPFLSEGDFFKDEIGVCRRERYTPKLRDFPHVVETRAADGFTARSTAEARGWSFWNGSLVGGATNFMSGFFHRMKPDDFRLRSAYGPVEGADVVDWPIGYDDLEPYYALVEREVGVSGRAVPHPFAEPRSTADFPMPPLVEHPLARDLDQACARLGLHPFPVPRAILTSPKDGRATCAYSGFCGSYGCATGAKGSARAALLSRAIATGRCEVRARCTATRIESDAQGRVTGVRYRDPSGAPRVVDARVVVVACQAIESARLLLASTGPKHPRGLANGSGLVGRNLLFSSAASGSGDLRYADLPAERAAALRSPLPFVNRALQDWYVVDGLDGRPGPQKGGTLDFLLKHPNPIRAAEALARGDDGLVWGRPLQDRMRAWFQQSCHVVFEAFMDWLPHVDCRVELDGRTRDRFGEPVARVRVDAHPRQRRVAAFLAERGAEVLRALGAVEVKVRATGGPATNLLAGTCRFGDDPATSVLDPDCRAHEVENLFVADGSFMPTGGSVPYTWTIYANAFRVAERVVAQL